MSNQIQLTYSPANYQAVKVGKKYKVDLKVFVPGWRTGKDAECTIWGDSYDEAMAKAKFFLGSATPIY